MRLGQYKVVLRAEQLDLCRHTSDFDYALDDFTRLSYPQFGDYTDALIADLYADPFKFVNIGICIKKWVSDDVMLYVSPLADAVKFTELLADVEAPEPVPMAMEVLAPEDEPEPVTAMAIQEQSGLVGARVPGHQLLDIDHEQLRSKCRITPDGLISVYDALVWRDGCSPDNARQKFFRFKNASGNIVSDLERSDTSRCVADPTYKFTPDPFPTPVAPYNDILRLLAVIPGPGATRVRTQQARMIASMDNPVRKIQLMEIRQEELVEHCRTTPDGMVSIHDALALRDGGTTAEAGKRYNRWIKGSETVLPKTGPEIGPVSRHQFTGMPQPTPVAPFHEVLRLLAIIPGPGVSRVRTQQAELSTRAMAGDWDLQQAIQNRRAALPAAAQELLLNGLESSGEAKRMREEQHEEEMKAPKRARISYTSEQLIDFVKDICPTGRPDPSMLSEMWEQSDGTHTDFMAKYIKYCELQISVRKHFSDERRLDEKTKADLKLQQHQLEEELKLRAAELELKKTQAKEEIRLKEEKSREELRLQQEKSREELRLQEEQFQKELQLRAAELELKKEQCLEELKLKTEELKLKQEQSKEGLRLQESQTKDRQRLDELRLTEEIKSREKEVAATVKLLDQQTQTALAQTTKVQKEVEAAAIKNERISKSRLILADSDRRQVLARVFPHKIGAKCEIVGCPTFVSVFSCAIIEEPGYAAGDLDKLFVVCSEHAKLNRPRVHLVEHKKRKLEAWLYRFGCDSTGLCAVCGRCPLAVWHTETHMCHINPSADGGNDSLDNLVIGSVACNQQQGTKTLAEYHEQIRVPPVPVHKVCVPEERIDEAMRILTKKDKRHCKKCPTVRLEAMLAEVQKSKHIQITLDLRKRTF